MADLTGIEQAVSVAGSQRNLAEMLGVTQQLISSWCKRGYIPQRRVVEVEQATGISRELLLNPRLTDLLSREV